MSITTVGLDLAKSVSHLVCCNQACKIVRKKMLRRNQVLHFFSELSPCLVGVESCASALYQHIGNDSEFKVAIISLN